MLAVCGRIDLLEDFSGRVDLRLRDDGFSEYRSAKTCFDVGGCVYIPQRPFDPGDGARPASIYGRVQFLVRDDGCSEYCNVSEDVL